MRHDVVVDFRSVDVDIPGGCDEKDPGSVCCIDGVKERLGETTATIAVFQDTHVSSGGTQGANVRVLNNSYGGGGFTQSFLDAINAAKTSRILLCAAA